MDVQWEKDKEERLEAFLDGNRGSVEGEHLNTQQNHQESRPELSQFKGP